MLSFSLQTNVLNNTRFFWFRLLVGDCCRLQQNSASIPRRRTPIAALKNADEPRLDHITTT